MSPKPRGWSQPANETRAEDLAFLAATGETTQGAATRLGISLDALEKWTRTNNARDDWHRLLANERTPGHLRTGKVGVNLR